MKKRDTEFLYEIGCLRFVQRTWKQFLNIDFANVAEHTLRVAWIAMIIAKNEEGADLDKVMKMAIAHDISESRTGDTHYLSQHYTKRKEDIAIKDILKDTSLEDEFLNLWQESEAKESIEAKIVSDADNIDVDLELMEQSARGNTPPKKWNKFREEFCAKKLFTKTGKEIWNSLRESDPDDWHVNGPNLFTA